MSNGRWGSRFPIGNAVCSSIVFNMLAYRLACRRFVNGLNRLFRKPEAQPQNAASPQEALLEWFEQGYDKLNIGGGPKNLEGFINIDFISYPNVQRQITANILDIGFVPDRSISQVHSNHVIEHLTNADLSNQIVEWDRILKTDGLLTIRCPNALGAAYGFWFEPVIESQKEEFIRLGFPADEDFGNPADRWVHKDFFGLIHWLYGDPGNIGNQHLGQLTPTLLQEMLVTHGFNIIKIAEPEAINIVVVARKGNPPAS